MLAKPELLPASFFTLLHLCSQIAPALVILGLELLGREALLTADYSRDKADRPTHDHARNGSASTCGSPLMDPCYPKAMFQIIVGSRQSLHLIAIKQTSREVVGDMTK